MWTLISIQDVTDQINVCLITLHVCLYTYLYLRNEELMGLRQHTDCWLVYNIQEALMSALMKRGGVVHPGKL